MKTKHTQGEWQSPYLSELGRKGDEIQITEQQAEANAKKMLEALQMIVKNAPDNFHIPTWDKVLSAIKQATK